MVNLGMFFYCVNHMRRIHLGFMTSEVYSSKWTTDMNLFYSLGDPKLFLNLQVLCRNADAVGGTIGGVLGNFLYTVDPVGPFIFTCGLACDLADIRYVLIFGHR